MAEQLTEEQLNQVLFLNLVTMFQTAAMQHMGKLMDPVTQKIERDLEQAKFSIDIIGMLEAKTKGNLSDEERRFLDHVLFELRINYVDEVRKDAEKKEEPQAEQNSEEKAKPEQESNAEAKSE